MTKDMESEAAARDAELNIKGSSKDDGVEDDAGREPGGRQSRDPEKKEERPSSILYGYCN